MVAPEVHRRDEGVAASRTLTEVAVGIVQRSDGLYLLTTRPQGKAYAGYWEFPGGKVEADESVEAALVRELDEEVALPVALGAITSLMKIPFEYPDKHVLLDVCWVEANMNDALLAHGAEGQEVRWVHYSRLNEFTFPDANQPIVVAIQQRLDALN